MPRRNKSVKNQQFVFFETCRTKRRYNNEKEAQKIAEIQMLENMSLELAVYKCNECKFWHLTRTSSN